MFKTKHSFEERCKESERIRTKYSDRIPVIIQREQRSTTVPRIDRNKFLVPDDMCFSQFLFIIRKRIDVKESEAIYLFVKDKLVPATAQVKDIYSKHHDEDGFLYVFYAAEATFG